MFRNGVASAAMRLWTQLAGTILCFAGASVVLSIVSVVVGHQPAELLVAAPLLAFFGLPYVVAPVLLVALCLEWLMCLLPRPADAVATGLVAASLQGWFVSAVSAGTGTWAPWDPLTLLVGAAAAGGRLCREPLAARALAVETALGKAA